MSKKCPKCKAKINSAGSYCTQCGAFLGVPKNADKKKKKLKPKRDYKKLIKRLSVFVVIIAVIAFIWFAIGNAITLTIRSDKDIEIINTGSLEVPGATYSSYSQLPDFVVEMLGEDPKAPDYGTLMSEIVPRVRVERNKVNGFFGGSSVEYTVYAPDMESWLLNFKPSQNTSSEELLEEMKKYIPEAPLRSQVVTVEYTHDGIFGWQGNYMDRDFTNAVSGGINTAYNELYSQFSAELEGQLK